MKAILLLPILIMLGISQHEPIIKVDKPLKSPTVVYTVVQPPRQPIARERATQTVTKPPTVQETIIKWADYYGVSRTTLLRIAKCESSYNPKAVNHNYYAGGGHPSGVFQFLPETFRRYQKKAGLSGLNVFNADDNVRVAAYAFSVGGSNEWECR